MLRSNPFQSHYGLILSKNNLIDALKLYYNFQSHYGLILSELSSSTSWKAGTLSIPLWSDFIIQFGAAAIDSVATLSIPLWSDFIHYSRRVVVDVFGVFQSHYGLILSRSVENSKRLVVVLSIPLWSDFIQMHKQDKLSFRPAFNPTMV